jgi:hypothetical protein
LRDEFDEFAVTLKTELAGFCFERRLVRGCRQLMQDKGAQRYGNEDELSDKLLDSPTQPVKPDAKPLVEFAGTAPLQPYAKSVSENYSLR